MGFKKTETWRTNSQDFVEPIWWYLYAYTIWNLKILRVFHGFSPIGRLQHVERNAPRSCGRHLGHFLFSLLKDLEAHLVMVMVWVRTCHGIKLEHVLPNVPTEHVCKCAQSCFEQCDLRLKSRLKIMDTLCQVFTLVIARPKLPQDKVTGPTKMNLQKYWTVTLKTRKMKMDYKSNNISRWCKTHALNASQVTELLLHQAAIPLLAKGVSTIVAQLAGNLD